MRIQANNALLLIVDLQARLLPAISGAESIVEHSEWLIQIANSLEVPILATEHCPDRIGVTEERLRSLIAPENLIAKTHFSAVTEGNLLAHPLSGATHWIICGTEAHVCVQQTVLDLLAAGKSVFLVDEGVGSRQPRDKQLALQRMQQNGAEIVSREMVAFEWLADANHPQFREILKNFIR